MQKPDTPDDEEVRLQALRSSNILDTPAEERFDRLTRLAARMFDVPIALVSIVDENRQWFKSSVGLGVTETPREISFCGHTILGEDVLMVNDASSDTRFMDNPLVVGEPHIRFYAGYPLKYLDGSKLGTLCLIDTRPRDFDEKDVEDFRDLVELAEHELIAVQMATLDELTGISNRRGFITLAQKSLDICMRQDIPVSLVFLDLNDFKSINDRFGHQEGDRALIAFADMMKHTFRDSDVFARLGGDEFAVLLTAISAENSEEIIERFRTIVNEHNRASATEYDICFSDGIANVCHEQGQSIESLLQQADAVMYANKPAPVQLAEDSWTGQKRMVVAGS